MNWIQDILTESPFVQGGLALMIAGWLGYQARALPMRVFEVARERLTRVIEIREQHPLYDAWLAFLTESACRRGGPRTLEVRAVMEEYTQRASTAHYAAGSDSFWSRICGRWCRVTVQRESSGAGGAELVRKFIIRVEVIFGSRDDLVRMLEAVKVRANVVENRQLVDLCNKYGSSSTITLPKRDPSTLCLPKGFFERLETRVREFAESRDDYERLGIPWRLGILLHGFPGTGKTSIAHTLASTLDRRLAVIPLADLRADEDLFSAFEGVKDESIVLIEDVDCAFHQRESEDAEGITFSGFLNCIDGVIAPQNGRVLVMSTNHIDRLDPALVRPGRADIKVEVPLLSAEAATDYVDRLFAHVSDRHDIVQEVMELEQASSAVLINRLMREQWRRRSGTQSETQGEAKAIEPVARTPARTHRRSRIWRQQS